MHCKMCIPPGSISFSCSWKSHAFLEQNLKAPFFFGGGGCCCCCNTLKRACLLAFYTLRKQSLSTQNKNLTQSYQLKSTNLAPTPGGSMSHDEPTWTMGAHIKWSAENPWRNRMLGRPLMGWPLSPKVNVNPLSSVTVFSRMPLHRTAILGI